MTDIKNNNSFVTINADANKFRIDDEAGKLLELQKLKEKMDGEVHSILYPRKEGKRNFKNLPQQEKDQIEDQNPLIKTMNGCHFVRTSLQYFPGKDSDTKMVVTGYQKVTDIVVDIIGYIIFFMVIGKIMKKIIK